MRKFDSIRKRAADKTGGDAALMRLLEPLSKTDGYKELSDSDFLEEMAKCVFRSGFVWKIIEKKWPGFCAAFDDFDVTQCAMLSEEEIDKLAEDTRIVRH